MYPNQLGAVMQFIKGLPATSDDKVDLFMGWARMVGVKVNASQRDAVRHTGSDYQ